MRVDLGVADALGNVEFEVAAGHEYPLDQKLFFVSRKDAKARRCRAGPRANPVAEGDTIMKALRAIAARRSNSAPTSSCLCAFQRNSPNAVGFFALSIDLQRALGIPRAGCEP